MLQVLHLSLSTRLLYDSLAAGSGADYLKKMYSLLTGQVGSQKEHAPWAGNLKVGARCFSVDANAAWAWLAPPAAGPPGPVVQVHLKFELEVATPSHCQASGLPA